LLEPACLWACSKCGTNCQCGPACRCDARPASTPTQVNVRKNASSLSDSEKQDFIDAIYQLKREPPDGGLSIYDTFVLQHGQSFVEGHAHGGAAFLPWHRQFLLEFERELRQINPKVTIPYWDFTVDNSPNSSIWAPNFLGGGGLEEDNFVVMDGPFRQGQWVIRPEFDGPDLRRQFGLFAPSLPTATDVEAALAVMVYDTFSFDRGSPIATSFRNFVEGFGHPSGEAEMHNRVHLWLGGSSAIDLSPNDPIFWMLHANFDRIWAQWEDQFGLSYAPLAGGRTGHNLHDVMFPFDVTPANVLDHRTLGYVYDTEVTAVPEPSGWALAVLGGIAMAMLAWRRTCSLRRSRS
jgi:tyrosinase